MLPCSDLVYRCVGSLSVTTANLLSLPDEILEKVAIVLGEEENFSSLNDFLQVTNELLTIRGQLLRGRGKRL